MNDQIAHWHNKAQTALLPGSNCKLVMVNWESIDKHVPHDDPAPVGDHLLGSRGSQSQTLARESLGLPHLRRCQGGNAHAGNRSASHFDRRAVASLMSFCVCTEFLLRNEAKWIERGVVFAMWARRFATRGRSFVKPVGEDKARARCGLAGPSDLVNGRWRCGWSCGRSRPMEGRTASSPPAGDKADWAASKIYGERRCGDPKSSFQKDLRFRPMALR